MVDMHIHVIPNRNSKPAILLRESYREDGKVKKRTLANLSHFPLDQVDTLSRALKGEKLAPVDSLFEVIDSKLCGHANAVRLAMKRLGFEKLVSSNSSRERDLVVAMVAARILEPDSKLATTRWWNTTTLAEDLGVDDAVENELYAAMDWLLDRQGRIEKKLSGRHLAEDGLVLYDLTSSYVEGESCPLAALGYSRDGKKGMRQINYGLLTDERGCPVSVSVFPGNTADASTLVSQAQKAREEFGIDRFVLVGDRGMISSKQIEQLREMGDVDWITALRSGQIRKLLEGGTIDMSLFDKRDLYEVAHPDFPGERLVVCRNPLMAERRAHTRQSLIEATLAELEKVRRMVAHNRLKGKEKIGVRVGRVVKIQDGQAHPSRHRRGLVRLPCAGGERKGGGGDGRVVCDPYQSGGGPDGGGGRCTSLQGSVEGGASVSITEINRSQSAPHLPPPGEASTLAHLPVYAGLLRRVAHEGSLAGVVVQ